MPYLTMGQWDNVERLLTMEPLCQSAELDTQEGGQRYLSKDDFSSGPEQSFIGWQKGAPSQASSLQLEQEVVAGTLGYSG